MRDTIFLGGDIEITIGGVKLNGFKDLKMKNEDKYIPKVGEECKFMMQGNTSLLLIVPEFVNDNFVVGTSKNNHPVSLARAICTFYPIQTKSDIEREQLIDILRKNYTLTEGRVQSIQEAGFTIPKKIKRSDILQLIFSIHSALTRDQVFLISDKICNLLGDLVEQD